MRRIILLGDSPYIGEVEGVLQYILDRYESMGINRIINKFRVQKHVFVDPFIMRLTNEHPELFTVSLYKYGDLIPKKNKELFNTYPFNFLENTEEDLCKKGELAWCGFTHDYALSYLITKGYKDIVLIGTADFVSGPHFSNPYDLKCSEKLKFESKRFIEDICCKKALIRTCNPKSILDIPRIDINELLKY
jgi:hypothetical protein